MCGLAVFVLVCSSLRGAGGLGLGLGALKYSPPLGPVHLMAVNSSTVWGDLLEDALQPALDLCKSVRMCNTSELFTFTNAECSECHPCSCDEGCYLRQDCCIDKQLRDVSERRVLDPPLPVPPAVSGCRDTYLTPYDLAAHVFMVDTCLKNWRDEEVVDRCLRPPPNETFSYWPVWSRHTNAVYRNVDCARCNNESVEEVVQWNLKVACDRSVYLKHSSDVVEAMERALEEPTCQILFVPPKECSPVPCRPVTGHYIDRCNVTGLRHGYDQTLWKACEVFHGQVAFSGNTYKNAFCAMCNYNRMRVPGTCDKDPPFPFFVEMDGESYRHQSGNKASGDNSCGCKEFEIYDKFEDQCRPLQCSMTRQLQDGRCQTIVTNSSGVFYDLALSLTPEDPTEPVQLRGRSPLNRIARNIRTAFMLQGSHSTGWHVMTHVFRVTAETEDVQSHSLSEGGDTGQELLRVIRFKVHIKFCSTWPEPPEAMEDRLFDLMNSRWNVSVEGHVKRSFKASPAYVGGPKEGNDGKTFQRVRLLSSRGRSKELVVDILDDSIESHGGELLETNYYLPLSEALRCARVSFNLSGGEGQGKGPLVVNRTSGTVHHLPSNKFISFQFVEVEQDGEVSICADQLFDGGSRVVREAVAVHFFSSQLLVVTVTFQVLSVIFLFLVLFTFLVFAELRTVAGKNLLGLVSTLILAVALIGGSVFGVGSLAGCQVLGVVAHFCLLSLFTWALICLFHSYHLFNSTSGSWLDRCLNEHHIFRKYVLASLLVPFVIVVVTIVSYVIHEQDDCATDLGYGQGICFVSAFNSLMVTICLSLLVFFITVGLAVWALREQRSLLNNHSDSFRQHFRHFLVQAFLTGLLAVAAFLQMLALLKDEQSLWYFALLLYLSLALYIFVMFVCRKQVLKMWCAWLAALCVCGRRQRTGHRFSPVDT